MPLWFVSGEKQERAALARANLGADVYLCAPGPSLVPVERQPGIYIAALTKAYPLVKPDIWFGMDEPQCYDRRIWWEGFVKVARGGYQSSKCEGLPIAGCPNTFFADVDLESGAPLTELFLRKGKDARFAWHAHTLGVGLHILLTMGARRLHFCGFDLKSEPGADYHSSIGLDLPPKLRGRNQRLFAGQVAFLKEFTLLGATFGVEAISCTPGSPINEFMEYRELSAAIALSTAHVPAAGRVLHTAQVHQEAAAEIIAAGRRPVALPLTPGGIRQALVRRAGNIYSR